ncbi:hypothetical protein CEXT_447491 [Caerostris extrusa]|uniref:Uncharacterized protein n=1 Tax=Caerostris extrusa TaxID=172846 RepID=A0AAV4USJ8_CAEEX|nr:hypothetical protein CEXT_447491 [Caerostris extrusa]
MEQSLIQPTINCLPKIIILFYVPWRLERENNLPTILLSLGLQFWFRCSSVYGRVECFQTDRGNFDAECWGKNSRYLLLDSSYYCGVWLVHWNWKRCLTS